MGEVTSSYQKAIDSLTYSMQRANPEQQLQMARSLNMYLEEANAIRQQGAPQESQFPPVYSVNPVVNPQPIPSTSGANAVSSIGQVFTDIGNGVGKSGGVDV